MLSSAYMGGLDALGGEQESAPGRSATPVPVVIIDTPWQIALRAIEMVAIVYGFYRLVTR